MDTVHYKKDENSGEEIQEDAKRLKLDELDSLEVIEAEELQEGVAFHAFRFHSPTAL